MPEEVKRSRKQWEAFVEIDAGNTDASTLLKQMMADGFTEQEARVLLARKKHSRTKTNILILLLGIALFFLGIMLTVSSYSTVSSSGGKYFVFFGAVIVGILLFIYGVVKLVARKG